MNEWTVTPLGDFADSVDYGVTASAAQEPVGPKFLRITDIQDGAVDWRGVPWCECSGRTAEDARLAPGDIVFARTGATTGKSFLIDDCPTDAVFASYLIRVRVGSRAEPRYLSQFFQTPDYWAQINKGARGVAQPGVNATTLKALNVPLPPLPVQRRIAEVLGRAEALRAKRRAALTQLDTLTQSIFLDLFGDPIRNTHGLPVRPMIDLVDPNRPISYGILMPGPDQDVGVKYVRVVDMKDGGIELLGIRKTTEAISNSFRRSLLKPGDLLMSIRGHVGRFAVVPPELDGANITQDTARLAIQGVSSIFVRECLRTEAFQRWMAKHTKGVAVRGINLGDVKQMPIILPSQGDQDRFARLAIAVDKLKSAHRASLAKLDALFASLQHRAFRGEL